MQNMFYDLQSATLEEIRQAFSRICRDYLTGRWKVATPEQLVVKRISGGLSNFLYYVSLPDLDDLDQQEVLKIEQEQKNKQGNNIISNQVKVTSPFAKNNNIYTESNETKEVAVESPESLILDIVSGGDGDINADDDDDTAQRANPANKRRRFDSDCGDSTFLKRLHTAKQEPREVLLRIYGQTHGDHALESMITESVVFTLLSERNFGPKLYGIFPGGRIEQYIPARSLTTMEMSNAEISMKIAEKMGEIHSLNIPMSKEPDWIWNCMNRWLTSVDSIIKGKIESKPNSTVLQKQRELMGTIDYVKEMAWLRSVIDAGAYPVVFCHNDLQEGNILLRETNRTRDTRTPLESISILRSNFNETLGYSSDGNNHLESMQNPSSCDELDTTDDSASIKSEHEPDLIIIDFEYCAYNYRGFDLANHFIEWTFDYTNPQFPYFYHIQQQYSTAAQRRDFIYTYLRKFHEDELYEPTTSDLNMIETEIQLFTMLSHLFWSLWSVVNVTSAIQFGYWEYGIARILEYQQLKTNFLAK
ncbi:choline/ethanolamine kinase isoform X1 [Drosophila nasuta]|uniref:choline/ethanolamine kinase isoform X1 n=1 Tax=Drosophila nasuta TaxID=42062 RepID=UPI00295E368A|nr:choline/ethanolamine kinase isoform X1 [Drosophila nasuta]XP_060665275.1 choline/ethanolamine kinase isoform X1 [Drosophila nasuta]XP_060665276.1 choline/ethanolamine kinase isoform X1 [Drosophila nasuta]